MRRNSPSSKKRASQSKMLGAKDLLDRPRGSPFFGWSFVLLLVSAGPRVRRAAPFKRTRAPRFPRTQARSRSSLRSALRPGERLVGSATANGSACAHTGVSVRRARRPRTAGPPCVAERIVCLCDDDDLLRAHVGAARSPVSRQRRAAGAARGALQAHARAALPADPGAHAFFSPSARHPRERTFVCGDDHAHVGAADSPVSRQRRAAGRPSSARARRASRGPRRARVLLFVCVAPTRADRPPPRRRTTRHATSRCSTAPRITHARGTDGRRTRTACRSRSS